MTAAAYDRSLLARALRVAATLLLVILPALHAADGIAQAGATSVPGLRLPRDVVPLAYDARLRVDPNDDAFSGVIDLTVRVLEPTDIVWLNAKKLTILDAQGAILATPEEVLPATVLPGSDDVIGLQFARVLAAGEVRLSLRYTGSIQRTSGVGLFRQQEASRWYAVTQFEPLDARRVFPSFDEPDRKATWKLTLTVPAAMRAFANMPVEAERAAEKGWREVSFQRSPPLPSYLVAFAVGEFDVRDGGRAGVNNTPISIITPKGRAAEAAYAATHTGTILAATERYFGRPYPFPKLDLLAYPLATFGGAMENAGLVTYSARNLLARPEEMSPLFEQRFVGITAHEIAHMWFGDYVTMAWWNDLWLNESFASWMASTITNELRPDWSRDGWRSRQRSRAMELDRLVTARSIRQPVTEYGEVRAAFDGITYAKGETILTMFEQWLGADKFREGVRRYIGKHAWGNATAEDFFAALAADDDALVPALRGFVERAGVPLLDVALDCSGPPVLKLAQQRFLPVGTPPQKGEKWVFPACFEFGDATARPAGVRAGERSNAGGAAARGRMPAMGRRQPRRPGLLPAAPDARALRGAAAGGVRAGARRLRGAAGRSRRCWRAMGRSASRSCCRSPRGRRRTSMRRRRGAPTSWPAACRRRWSTRRTVRGTPPGSATTSVIVPARSVGSRGRARRPTCCACATRPWRWWPIAVRTRRSRARRSSSRSAG